MEAPAAAHIDGIITRDCANGRWYRTRNHRLVVPWVSMYGWRFLGSIRDGDTPPSATGSAAHAEPSARIARSRAQGHSNPGPGPGPGPGSGSGSGSGPGIT